MKLWKKFDNNGTGKLTFSEIEVGLNAIGGDMILVY